MHIVADLTQIVFLILGVLLAVILVHEFLLKRRR